MYKIILLFHQCSINAICQGDCRRLGSTVWVGQENGVTENHGAAHRPKSFV